MMRIRWTRILYWLAALRSGGLLLGRDGSLLGLDGSFKLSRS